jgi:hypothetical protein
MSSRVLLYKKFSVNLLLLTERVKKHNAIPVTGREDSEECEWSRLPHLLETTGSQMAVRIR